MLWWQQTHKSWPGLEHICQWDDKFGACSENMKRILSPHTLKSREGSAKPRRILNFTYFILFIVVSGILSKTALVHETPFYHQKPTQCSQIIWDERMRRIHCVDVKLYIFCVVILPKTA